MQIRSFQKLCKEGSHQCQKPNLFTYVQAIYEKKEHNANSLHDIIIDLAYGTDYLIFEKEC